MRLERIFLTNWHLQCWKYWFSLCCFNLRVVLSCMYLLSDASKVFYTDVVWSIHGMGRSQINDKQIDTCCFPGERSPLKARI